MIDSIRKRSEKFNVVKIRQTLILKIIFRQKSEDSWIRNENLWGRKNIRTWPLLSKSSCFVEQNYEGSNNHN